MDKKTVKVYDTFTGKMVEIEVSQEVYEAYMRTEWNIHDNNESFYAHEIQFSQLIGGNENAFDNFHEFILDGDLTAESGIMMANLEKLRNAIKELDESDLELICMLYFKEMPERACAEYYGISCKNIHKKKVRILAELNKLLKK